MFWKSTNHNIPTIFEISDTFKQISSKTLRNPISFETIWINMFQQFYGFLERFEQISSKMWRNRICFDTIWIKMCEQCWKFLKRFGQVSLHAQHRKTRIKGSQCELHTNNGHTHAPPMHITTHVWPWVSPQRAWRCYRCLRATPQRMDGHDHPMYKCTHMSCPQSRNMMITTLPC